MNGLKTDRPSRWRGTGSLVVTKRGDLNLSHLSAVSSRLDVIMLIRLKKKQKNRKSFPTPALTSLGSVHSCPVKGLRCEKNTQTNSKLFFAVSVPQITPFLFKNLSNIFSQVKPISEREIRSINVAICYRLKYPKLCETRIVVNWGCGNINSVRCELNSLFLPQPVVMFWSQPALNRRAHVPAFTRSQKSPSSCPSAIPV